MNINAEYKNSVFSLLFSNPDVLRELYGAIEGVVLPSNTLIDINTLSGVLYMDQEGNLRPTGSVEEQINDLSFIIPRVAARKALKQMANMPSAKATSWSL